MSTFDDSNLTTDAFPSPPRENVDESTTGQNETNNTNNRRKESDSRRNSQKNGEDSENEDSETSRKCCSSGRRSSYKTHEGYHGPNAYASVINISNATGIQIGSNYTYYINSTKDSKSKQPKNHKDVPKTEKIMLLLSSDECVTIKDIQFLSNHIDETWMETARKLDYSEGQISQFYCDFNKISMKEVIYQFLLDWLRNNGKDATTRKLAGALWNSDQKECVSRWSLK